LRIWHKGQQTRVVSLTVKKWPQEVWETYKSGKSNESLFTKITDYGFELADVNDDLKGKFHLDAHATGRW